MIDLNIENILLVLILIIGFLMRLPYNDFPGNSYKFYAIIKQSVINKGLRTEIEENGKSRAKEYSWSKIIETHKAVFKWDNCSISFKN